MPREIEIAMGALDKLIKKEIGVQADCYENVSYVLRDKDGNAKPLFKTNWLGTALLRLFRKFIQQPIDPVSGQVKAGRLNALAAYGLLIPFVTGLWVTQMTIPNLVTYAGLAGLASRINGAGAVSPFIYIAVGIGTTAAAYADTTLESEIVGSGLARASATASRVTTTQTNDTAQLVYSFSVTGTKAVTESGVLSETAAGVLLCRQVFSAINVVDTDTLQVTWKVKVS